MTIFSNFLQKHCGFFPQGPYPKSSIAPPSQCFLNIPQFNFFNSDRLKYCIFSILPRIFSYKNQYKYNFSRNTPTRNIPGTSHAQEKCSFGLAALSYWLRCLYSDHFVTRLSRVPMASIVNGLFPELLVSSWLIYMAIFGSDF